MFIDPTEGPRRALVALLNDSGRYSDDEAERKAELILEHGEDNVWDTEELTENFVVESFLAPFCKVRRKSDGQEGLVAFTHSPRFYFKFEPV